MNIQDILANPKLHKAASTFAVGYAKRMMEGNYDRLMGTEVGQKAASLSRPKKLAIEAALNGLAAYLSTKESKFADTPIKSFLWELAKDAPSELSKRLLNGAHAKSGPSHSGLIDVEVVKEEATVMEGLLKMPVEDLAAFLTWLQNATPEERHWMAETMAGLSEQEQAKLSKLNPEQAKLLLKMMMPKSEPAPPPQRGVFGSLADSLRAVNDRLEKRKP
jgi:hypothetical protein